MTEQEMKQLSAYTSVAKQLSDRQAAMKALSEYERALDEIDPCLEDEPRRRFREARDRLREQVNAMPQPNFDDLVAAGQKIVSAILKRQGVQSKSPNSIKGVC